MCAEVPNWFPNMPYLVPKFAVSAKLYFKRTWREMKTRVDLGTFWEPSGKVKRKRYPVRMLINRAFLMPWELWEPFSNLIGEIIKLRYIKNKLDFASQTSQLSQITFTCMMKSERIMVKHG